MTRLVRGLSVSLAALVVLLGAVPRAAEASLIGDSVTCTAGNLTCTPTTAIVGGGTEFVLSQIGGLFSVDVAASSITLGNIAEVGLQVDNGVGFFPSFGDLDSSLGDLVGVSVTTSAGVIGIDASDLSFTADSVTIALDGSRWPEGSTATISLIFAAAAVPVPATLLLVGSAGAGLGAVRVWRRRQVR